MIEKLTRITKKDAENIMAELKLVLSDEKTTTEETVSCSAYTEAASVMLFYDPATIQPAGVVPEEQRQKMINELIGCSELVADSSQRDAGEEKISDSLRTKTYKIFFSLKDEARKRALDKLSKEGRIPKAIAANLAFTKDLKLPAQHLLTKYLQDEKIYLNELNEDELFSYYKINSWLEYIPSKHYISRQKIIDRIDLVEMVRPFKRLTGIYDEGVYKEKFSGRKRELAQLRSYVGVADPKGIQENLKRLISNFFSSEKKPLLIFGIGGVGKSTLLAKFILEHLEAQTKHKFPFVYLDFDRPNLSALEPATLLIEAARQLSIQYRGNSFISENFSSFYFKWNPHYETLLEAGSSELINLNSESTHYQKGITRNNLKTEFLTLITSLNKIEKKPFLIVLDTFEEVQYKGIEFVNAILDFSEELLKNFAAMRIILSGRSPVNKKRLNELELGNLDEAAAADFIINTGISDAVLAKKIAEEIGGNPLTLKLAASIVQQYGSGALDKIETKETKFHFLKNRLPEIEIQGNLYERILEHIKIKDVRKIAHPGMVLRKITPELILKVLAPHCDLDNIDTIEKAKALFLEMSREVALTNKTSEYVIKHRSDVRKVILKLIMASDKQETAKRIHASAVEYYETRKEIQDRAEEFYHRLALDESPRTLTSRWIDGIEDYLAGSIDELPEKAQAFLMAKAGIESPDLSIWALADVEDQNTHISKQAANLLNAGMPERVLLLLDQSDVIRTPALKLIEIRALRQLGDFKKAKSLSSEALQSYYADDIPSAIRNEFLRYGRDVPKDFNFSPQDASSEFKYNTDDDDMMDSNMTTLSV